MSTPNISEIRRRLQEFSKEHENDADEKQHAQQFWRDFYMCFGLSKSSASMFEARVLKVGGVRGYIDSFIPGVLLVEQKSLGRNLNDAYIQAQAYFHAITNEFEKPKYIITCDFQTFHLYNLQNNAKEPLVCKLSELSQCADWFMFLVEKEVHAVTEELPVNRKAAEQIAKLHDALLRANYKGKDLEIFLTRLLFCLFADDTGIFGDDGQFKKLVEKSKEDGSDLGSNITLLFQVLNTAKENRQTNLDDSLKVFEYVNGSLFEEQIQIPYFNFDLRTILLNCVKLDWSGISPAIFGAMFQAVLEDGATDTEHRKESRRELGAHYTSERNILKVIEPLFLNELQDEFVRAKGSESKLLALYDKLPTLKFFDPACGCGNFLVIAYREIRNLENDVIGELLKLNEDKKKNNFKGGLLDIATLCRVNVEQFYGIEIDGAAAHIARVAMYITDHQLNLASANKFGKTRATVPLVSTPHIHCGNALTVDWNNVIKANDCRFVFGNPPFIGKKEQTAQQKKELLDITRDIRGGGVLDYVCCWYILATNYISTNKEIKCAFVSTNSITQGEQVGILWGYLSAKGIEINFAHRTFRWSNEGKGVAAVHCVIIGFNFANNTKLKYLYSYEDGLDKSGQLSLVKNINPYLVDAPFVIINKRSSPLCNVAEMNYGSMPIDKNFLTIEANELSNFINEQATNAEFIRKYVGGNELINNEERYCLWLVGADPNKINKSKLIKERIEAVRKFRLESERETTNKLAHFPSIFGEIRQPDTDYLALPKVSSENRKYMPISFVAKEVIASGSALIIPSATLYEFGVLQSSMHMAWMRTVCGRMKSDYQYSASIVYNNYVWPKDVVENFRIEIEDKAKEILDTRATFHNTTLATLYNNTTSPISLIKAHLNLDKAVDKAYGYAGADDDASRVAFLFKKYEDLTSLLPPTETKKKRVKKIADSDMFN